MTDIVFVSSKDNCPEGYRIVSDPICLSLLCVRCIYSLPHIVCTYGLWLVRADRDLSLRPRGTDVGESAGW